LGLARLIGSAPRCKTMWAFDWLSQPGLKEGVTTVAPIAKSHMFALPPEERKPFLFISSFLLFHRQPPVPAFLTIPPTYIPYYMTDTESQLISYELGKSSRHENRGSGHPSQIIPELSAPGHTDSSSASRPARPDSPSIVFEASYQAGPVHLHNNNNNNNNNSQQFNRQESQYQAGRGRYEDIDNQDSRRQSQYQAENYLQLQDPVCGIYKEQHPFSKRVSFLCC
jgi:hypothetical protein